MAKKNTTKYQSNKQEKKVASQMNGKTVVASGALWNAKADVRSDKYLVECKTTAKDYYCVTSKVWEKIQHEAISDSMRTPILAVEINNGTKPENYVVINFWLFEELIEASRGGLELEMIINESDSYISNNKSFRVHSLPKDSYIEHYSILRNESKVGVNSSCNELILLRWSDLLELMEE